MKIIKCGYNYKHASDFKIVRPNGSGDYVLLILRSPSFFILEGRQHIAKPGSVILFDKNTPQIYGAYGQEFINDWIHFEAEQSDVEWMNRLAICFENIIETIETPVLSRLVRNIAQEISSLHKNSEESANLYLRLLLLKLSDICAIKDRIGNPILFEKLSKIRDEIYAGPQKKWNVKELAENLAISLSYFHHQYKNFFGTSVKKDVTAARIEYAKYLLFSTDYSVFCISSMCGYENDVHFMRIFKEQTGLTPMGYRKISTQK